MNPQQPTILLMLQLPIPPLLTYIYLFKFKRFHLLLQTFYPQLIHEGLTRHHITCLKCSTGTIDKSESDIHQTHVLLQTEDIVAEWSKELHLGCSLHWHRF